MACLDLRLLGSFEARLKGGPAINLPTKKTKLLLAYLALLPGEAHSRQKLANLLWSDRGDAQARHSLRDALSSLRKALGEAEPSPLRAKRETVSLDVDAVEVDAVTFERLVATGTCDALEQALSLYRHDLLDGISIPDPSFEEWLFYERGRLRALALGAFEQLLAYKREAGEPEKVIEIAQRLLNLDPTHEGAHRELMLIYADQGLEAAALGQYQHCCAALERELGVTPGAQTETLYQDILQRRQKPIAKSLPLKLKSPPRRWARLGVGAGVGAGAGLLVAVTVVAVVAAGVAGAIWQFYPSPGPSAIALTLQPAPALELPDKPSIAVLPFVNMSGDPEQEYFSDGITDNIITELSRFGDLFVIARNSSFKYKGISVDVRQVSRELGVQYVLEGSVQKVGDKVRIIAQLVDATTGSHLWAERYDRDLEDILAVQDEVTRTIVATLAGGYSGQRLAEADLERARRKPTSDLKAYDYYLLGIEHKDRFTKEDMVIGRRLVEKAIELDPEFARAYAGLAWVHYYNWAWGWGDSPSESGEWAFASAQKAVALDPWEAEAHWALGGVYFWIKHQYDRGIAEYERAHELNPNHAGILADWGWILTMTGEVEEGIEKMQKAMRLNPYSPDWYLEGLGTGYYHSRRYEEAIAVLNKMLRNNPGSDIYLAASYAQLGREAEAQAMTAAILDAAPDFSGAHWAKIQPYKNQADRDHYVEGMRKAGLPG